MKWLLFTLIIFVSPVLAEEQANLTTAFDPDPRSISVLKVGYLNLNRIDQYIEIGLYNTVAEGVVKRHRYEGQEAINLMNTLNKVDLSSNSLNKRILNKLITDGVIDGSVSGTPE